MQKNILRDLGTPFSRTNMYENKDGTYDDIIRGIAEEHKEMTGDDLDVTIFDQVAYPGHDLRVSEIEMDEDDNETILMYELHSDDGFTVGKLLYELAKVLNEPGDENYCLCYLSYDDTTKSYEIQFDY